MDRFSSELFEKGKRGTIPGFYNKLGDELLKELSGRIAAFPKRLGIVAFLKAL